MELIQPSFVSSQNGVLETSLLLTAATHRMEASASVSSPPFELTTRLFNGTLPGPLLRLKAGDTLILDYINELQPGQGKPYIHNTFSAPNESNLHFHGLHVSGELPSDDVTHVVEPMSNYKYISNLPEDHMPGTHFIHPHRHGSTALQTGGGAAALIIVEDDPDTSLLPEVILDAREVLVVFQEMELDELQEVATDSGDDLLQLKVMGDSSSSYGLNVATDQFYLANGQMNPTVALAPMEWIRLRIVHAGWLEGRLNLRLPGSCEMQLIAKDGVYLPVLPRLIQEAQMANAGRADIMVRCSFADGTTDQEASLVDRGNNNRPLLTFVRTGDTQESASIPMTTMQFPTYLQDLRDIPASEGCSCGTNLDDMEGWFPEHDYHSPHSVEYIHRTYQGAIVERVLDNEEHPYHQHVHPFQIVSGGNGPYYQRGDWHDTLQGGHTVRYQPTVFTGKLMIHCHILTHEDEGMMGIEYIDPSGSNNTCTCTEFPPLLPLYGWILIGIAFLFLFIGLPAWWCLRRRRRAKEADDGAAKEAAGLEETGEETAPEL